MSLSHLGTDWHDQWNRVLRWQARIQTIRKALPEEEAAKTQALDDVYAFFMNCYHLQDWVKGSGHKSEAEVNAFVFGSDSMKLCRDVCNGVKHYRLDPGKNPTHQNWSTATRSADPVVVVGGRSSRKVGGGRGPRWVIETDAGDRDMFELADACVEEWRKFLGL